MGGCTCARHTRHCQRRRGAQPDMHRPIELAIRLRVLVATRSSCESGIKHGVDFQLLSRGRDCRRVV
jgi:hypothetical protein